MIVRCSKTSRGSLTVEAAVIIPVIILLVAGLVYMSLLWFQHVGIKNAAAEAAERGAVLWGNPAKDIDTGKIHTRGLIEKRLYWRFIDGDKEYKVRKVVQYTSDILNRYKIMEPLEQEIDVQVKECIIGKKLAVTIKSSFRMPAAGFLKIFGASDKYNISVRAESIIEDAPELIRNADFIIDMEKELEEKYPEFKDIMQKARETLQIIKDRAYEFAGSGYIERE